MTRGVNFIDAITDLGSEFASSSLKCIFIVYTIILSALVI